MRSTFTIIFYINRSKKKKDGTYLILGRITVDGKQAQFSVKQDIELSQWSVSKNRCIGKNKASKELNEKLDHYERQLKYHYNKLVENNAYVTAESLKNALLNIGAKETMLLKEFEAHNREYKKSIGLSRAKGTYLGYIHTCNSLEKFINHRYGLEDIAFKDLQYAFMTDFEFYLSVNLQFAPNTIFNIIQKVKRIVHIAINKEIIRKNPFADFIYKSVDSTRKYLSKLDLDKLMQTPMEDPKTELARVLFIFSTFTGLAFTDLYNLKWEDITSDNKGRKWIRIKRKKTGTESIIPLLDIALTILEAYKSPDTHEKVFDIPYYQIIHYQLGKIQKKLGLQSLSFHCSRHCEYSFRL